MRIHRILEMDKSSKSTLWYVVSTMELYLYRAKRVTLQYIATRSPRKVIALIAVFLLCVIIYWLLRDTKSMVSAVGCKSKIAQVRVIFFNEEAIFTAP